ncbi:NAD(P)H-binding protein [Salinactinospora qingdaonensis]|uniref:NAD(P)H-binding protein n=1 Tax=Salinactinospora qingdaonensis TaxID=702744 RepID=A0ABP7G2A5_9ACTN
MTQTDSHDQEITLVLGGTGKTGRRVAERLRAQGRQVRIGSRSAEPPFEWQDRSTWGPVLDGVTSAYVAYSPDAGFPGAAETIQAFAEQAAQAGVRHLVMLTGRGEKEAQRSEEMLRQAGTEWTIVRASFFAQNFSEDFLNDLVRGGVVAFPAGDVAEPFIDAEDIADVAVAALTEEGHTGQTYEITGPRSLTFAEAVAQVAEASGRQVHYQPISIDEFAAAMTEHGAPPEFVNPLCELFTEILDGRNATPTDGVQRALGRAPRDFADYARAAAASGAWDD